MKRHSRLKHTLALAALPLVLTACGSADTESMVAGLQKAGLSSAKAGCYSAALAESLKTDMFNQVAAYLEGGDSYDEALRRARRKFGADFREQMESAKGALAACGG